MSIYLYIGTVLFWSICFTAMKINLKTDLQKFAEKYPERVKIWQKPQRKYSSIAYIVMALFPILNVISGLAMTFGYSIIFQEIIESYEEDYTSKVLQRYLDKTKLKWYSIRINDIVAALIILGNMIKEIHIFISIFVI